MNQLSYLFIVIFVGLTLSAPIQTTLTWDSVWESGACGHISFKNSLGFKAAQFHFTAHLCQDLQVTSIWTGNKQDMGIVSTRTGPVQKWRLTSEPWWNLAEGATDLSTVGFCLSHPVGIAISNQNFKYGVELLGAKTTEPTCGNGVCNSGENKDNCAVDCGDLICAVTIIWDSKWEVGRCGHVEFKNYKTEVVKQFLFNIQLCDLGGSDITALWTGDKTKLSSQSGANKWLMKSAAWWNLAAGGSDKSTIGFCISHPKNKWTKDNMRVWLHLCTGGPCQGSCGNGVCESALGENASTCPQDCVTNSWCSLLTKVQYQQSSISSQVGVVSKESENKNTMNKLLAAFITGIFCLIVLGIIAVIAMMRALRKNVKPVRIEGNLPTEENFKV